MAVHGRRGRGWPPPPVGCGKVPACSPSSTCEAPAATRPACCHGRRPPWSGRPGVRVEQRFVPLRRAGVYAPGGLAAYPSSVVMNVVAAQAAGVGEVALATPPGRGGRGHPAVLGAASLLGVEEVWLLGGAQAVAALACGTATVPAGGSGNRPGNL